jgi:hypothetical protein
VATNQCESGISNFILFFRIIDNCLISIEIEE